MVMGKRSFERGTSADTISAILNDEPPSIAQLSPDTPVTVERVVRRCLEKDPAQRFHSASDLAFALEALSDPAIAPASGAYPIVASEPRNPRFKIAAGLLVAAVVIAAAAYFLVQPSPPPRVSNYVQLTHDGQQKSIIGTDGTRIYLSLGEVRAGSFAFRGVSEMSASGSEPKKISIMPSVNMVPVDLSPDGSQVLAIDGAGAPPKGPLWSLAILGGSPRRLGDII